MAQPNLALVVGLLAGRHGPMLIFDEVWVYPKDCFVRGQVLVPALVFDTDTRQC